MADPKKTAEADGTTTTEAAAAGPTLRKYTVTVNCYVLVEALDETDALAQVEAKVIGDCERLNTQISRGHTSYPQ